jgi:hypothetical protein
VEILELALVQLVVLPVLQLEGLSGQLSVLELAME